MERAVDFSNAASALFTPSQFFATVYNMVFKTGPYNHTCCKWRHHLLVNKTWANFQANYSAAAQDLRKLQSTAQSMGYHGANAASGDAKSEDKRRFQQDTSNALDNLAALTDADRTTLASITSTLAPANAEIAYLKRKFKIQSNPTDKDKNIFNNENYFWTDCFRCGKEYTSAYWKWPKEGHQTESTKAKKMGGSEK